MMNKNLPSGLALLIVAVVFAVIGFVERNAFAVKPPPPPQTIDAAYCIRCHSDARVLAAMRRKEGNTHFIFHGNTTVNSLIGKTPADVIRDKISAPANGASVHPQPLPSDWK